MKKTFLLFIISSGFTFLSCHHDSILPIIEPEIPLDPLNILWQTPHTNDTTSNDVITINGIYQGNPLYELSLYHPTTRYQFLDGKTGETNWEWDEKLPLKLTNIIKQNHIWNNLYIGNYRDNRIAIDLNSGKTVWHTIITDPNSCGSPRIGVINNNIYHSVEDCSSDNSFAFLFRTNITSLAQDTILTMYKKDFDGFTPGFESFGLHINSKNDSILIFQNRMVNWSTTKLRTDLYAYNLNTRNFEWQHFNFTPSGNSSVWDPVIWDDKVYFQGDETMYCLDAHSGAIIWSRTFEIYQNHLLRAKSILRDGRLIVHPEGRTIYALDPFTGNIIWQNDKVGEAPSQELQYHNGVIYWNFGELWAVDAQTGKILWQHASPNFSFKRPAVFNNTNVFIDPERGVLFTSDLFYAMCIKLIR